MDYVSIIQYDANTAGYFAYHPDLQGCMAQGATPAEAKINLAEAREFWIECLLEDGLPIPKPRELFGRVIKFSDGY